MLFLRITIKMVMPQKKSVLYEVVVPRSNKDRIQMFTPDCQHVDSDQNHGGVFIKQYPLKK